MKLIVAGSRTFRDYALVKRVLDKYTAGETEVVVISGCAPGADNLGVRWADERGYLVDPYPADWAKHGKGAGPVRNRIMATKGTHLVAFWDGQSPGTRNMIEEARKRGLQVKVVSI